MYQTFTSKTLEIFLFYWSFMRRNEVICNWIRELRWILIFMRRKFPCSYYPCVWRKQPLWRFNPRLKPRESINGMSKRNNKIILSFLYYRLARICNKLIQQLRFILNYLTTYATLNGEKNTSRKLFSIGKET